MIKFHHPRITVAVGNEKISVLRKSNVSRAIKMIGIITRHVPLPENPQYLASSTQLHHGVVLVVGRPDITVTIATQKMSRVIQTIPKRTQEFALWGKNQDRIFPAVKYQDISLHIDLNSGNR
ncbi:MAG: hypothetical protein IIC93_03645 [Chloroflexi bacterium]|nr:hypothetical protein [Chloroflexota bacterium]